MNATTQMGRQEAAEFLTNHGFRISRSSLAKLAVLGGGPAFRKFGRYALYDVADLLTWAESRCSTKVSSTSEHHATNAA